MANRSKLRFQISHVRFSIVFPVVLYAICNTLNLERLAKWFQHGDRVDYLGLSAYLLAGLCLFILIFALLTHRRTVKPFAILLTILSATATYFIAKYGVAIDSSMVLNAVHTDSTEVGQLLSLQMLPYAVMLIAVPVWLILLADITFAPSGRYFLDSLKVMGVALCVALLSLYAQYTAIFRAGNVSNKYIVYSLVPINIISGSFNAASKSLKPYLKKKSQQDVAISAHVAAPGNLVVVLAIGEASRKKNFGVYGYTRRNTTPVLQKTGGLYLLNGIATRASTLYALPKILEKKDIKLTTIVSRVGIPTSCYVNYTLYDNCASPGETTVNCGRTKCYDEDVVPLLKNNVGTYQAGYRFIVLHLGGGSHGPIYRDRHPPQFQQFQPICPDADVINKCSLEQLYNSYDNTILYVDHVLGQVVQTLDQSGVPYVFIYLSDHGESLMEGGLMFHGVPPGIALPDEQAQIPLIVKSSVPISIVERAEYRQPDVYDTVLDLFSIQSPTFDRAGSFIKKASGRAAARWALTKSVASPPVTPR